MKQICSSSKVLNRIDYENSADNLKIPKIIQSILILA